MRKVTWVLLAVISAGVWVFATHTAVTAVAVEHFVTAVEQSGAWGYALYAALVTATIVFLLPGFFLTLAGGFLFGPLTGTVLFLAGETVGSCLAFALARGLFRARVRVYFAAHPKLNILNAILAGKGWRYVALTRMTPFFPFKLSNYFFGASGYRFRDFFWGTLLGTVPLSFTMVYLGSLLPNLTGWQNTRNLNLHLAHGAALGVGALAVLGMLLLFRKSARVYRENLAALGRSEKKLR